MNGWEWVLPLSAAHEAGLAALDEREDALARILAGGELEQPRHQGALVLPAVFDHLLDEPDAVGLLRVELVPGGKSGARTSWWRFPSLRTGGDGALMFWISASTCG